MTDDDSEGVSRRRMLGGAAAASVGVAALAGCTSTQEKETNQAKANATKASDLRRPPKPSSVSANNEFQQYILDSLAYQNRMAELQAKALANYMEAEKADANNN